MGDLEPRPRVRSFAAGARDDWAAATWGRTSGGMGGSAFTGALLVVGAKWFEPAGGVVALGALLPAETEDGAGARAGVEDAKAVGGGGRGAIWGRMREDCACAWDEERAATLASSAGRCAVGEGEACAKETAAAGEWPALLLVVGCITIVDVGSFGWCRSSNGGGGGGTVMKRGVREPTEGGLENERGGGRRGARGSVVMMGEIEFGGRVGFSISVGRTAPRAAAAATAAVRGLWVVVTPKGRCSCLAADANEITGWIGMVASASEEVVRVRAAWSLESTVAVADAADVDDRVPVLSPAADIPGEIKLEVRPLVLITGISGNVEEMPFIDGALEKLGITLVYPEFIVPNIDAGGVLRKETRIRNQWRRRIRILVS